MEFSNQFCMRVHTRGFFMFDHKIRQQFFESAIPFSLSEPNLLHLLCAYSLHQRPDGDTHCRNCGDLHRTQECSRFALVFTSDLTTPTASRYGRDRGRAAPRSRTRSRSVSTARSFSRGRSVARGVLRESQARGKRRVCPHLREERLQPVQEERIV